MTGPDKDIPFPLAHHRKRCFLKNIVPNSDLIVGNHTYYDDLGDVYNFEKNVRCHFDFIGDQLIMNGGNHLSEAISAYPFALSGHGWKGAMEGKSYPHEGDTVPGNDVRIGHNVTIMPGLSIGDAAIVATHALVTRDAPPYATVGTIRRRYSESGFRTGRSRYSCKSSGGTGTSGKSRTTCRDQRALMWKSLKN